MIPRLGGGMNTIVLEKDKAKWNQPVGTHLSMGESSGAAGLSCLAHSGSSINVC